MALEKFMLPCLFKTLFGYDCLGCGFQRALFLLFDGEFFAAFMMYPPLYTTLLFFGFGLFYLFSKSKKNKKLLWIFAFINGAIMIGAYCYKHIYL